MKLSLVFPFWGGDNNWWPDIHKLAQAFADCPIYVIKDPPMDAKLRGLMERKAITPFHAYGMARWFAILELLKSGKLRLPIAIFDWDVAVFQSLPRTMEPFADCDLAVSEMFLPIRHVSTCGLLNRIEPLEEYARLVRAGHKRNDMEPWGLIARNPKFRTGNLFDVVNGGVFDHNIHVADGRFDAEPDGAKVVVWVENKPHFRMEGGRLVRANTIHCWGSYKNRTAELVAKAGL